jgi:hypothetical protein
MPDGNCLSKLGRFHFQDHPPRPPKRSFPTSAQGLREKFRDGPAGLLDANCGISSQKLEMGDTFFDRLLFRRHGAQIVVARSPGPASGPSFDTPGCFLAAGACSRDLLHHRNEALLVCLAQVGHGLKMSGTNRHFHLSKQLRSSLCEPAQLCPAISPVDGALDKLAQLQPLKCTGGRGAIESDIRRQSCLVGGSALRQSREQAILQRRDLKGGASLLEQGNMDLMKAPQQKAGTPIEWPRRPRFLPVGFSHHILRAKRGTALPA